ncbi:amino acid adenylation domain-containing protein [Amycolatopsis sp. cg5]|uniref:amino acid adenylation domain-containing protein n=1 Tax=Amycolatopsis sp. cg5 TaxID=3238802 RepID=UPI0035249688
MTLTHYLRESAVRDGDAVAVRYADQSITYRELDERSTAVAAALAAGGVRAGDRVALWLPKTIEAIVAVHAVLKCGAAYVPIDPAMPVKRAETILRDCAVAALVAGPEHAALLDDPPFVLETGEHWADGGDFEPSEVDEDQLAYVLYTSGSTGVPKGVMLTHRNATSFVDWAVAEFAITGQDRLSGHAPLHFDLSILDVFAAAKAGAALVLVPERHKALGTALTKLVHEAGITVWYSVPGALVKMLEAKNNTLLGESKLRTVLFAGEVFPLKHLRSLRNAVPAAGLCNLYGPTETNVCTYHWVTEHDLADDRTVPPPIGKPCPYARAFVEDGELWIGGDSVMAGYWGDPAKTAERFAEIDGVRAYRTGDLVRENDRGEFVFGGRRDHLVKTRGYRVELGEVEAALLRLDGVTEAVCVAVPDDEAGTLIEAYLTGSTVDDQAVRRHCLELLPRYMVPVRFVTLENFPRTANGKVDRQELARSGSR